MLNSTPDTDFEAFYNIHWKYVYRLCLSYMKNPSEAEDITEDVFVKVLADKRSFQDELHERKWLTITAINLCKNRLKSWKYRLVHSIEDTPELAAPEPEAYDEVLDSVMKLPVKYKDVIWLYYYEGYQTDEIAELLHRPSSTIRGQIRDARKRLEKILGGDVR